jgi:hypothetical protein
MMLFVSHMIWFVIDGIRGTFWLRFDSILEKIGETGYSYFVSIISLLYPDCMIFIFI